MNVQTARSEKDEASRAEDEDVLLLRRVAEKDTRAFEQLYLSYHRRLMHFISRLTRQLDVVEEIHSDTMMVVWQSAKKFDGRSRVSTWIFGIAYFRAIKQLKKLQRHSDLMVEQITEPVDSRQPDAPVSQSQWRDIIDTAMTSLSPEHRAVIELTYYHGYSYPEISRIVDCPVNTVKTRMLHARKRLRKLLPAFNGRLHEHL